MKYLTFYDGLILSSLNKNLIIFARETDFFGWKEILSMSFDYTLSTWYFIILKIYRQECAEAAQ